jgi:hypothetical protein
VAIDSPSQVTVRIGYDKLPVPSTPTFRMLSLLLVVICSKSVIASVNGSYADHIGR